MTESISAQTIELLLASMYSTRGDDGLHHQFLFGAPGAPLWNRNLCASIFFRRSLLIHATLYVRKSGRLYLKSMPVPDIWKLLTDFIAENYQYLANETYLQRFETSYAERVSSGPKAKLAELLAVSNIFVPTNSLTLYPLVPVRVEDFFESSPYFFASPNALTNRLIGRDLHGFAPEQFPPDITMAGRKDTPASWLGVRSPIVQASNKMKAAILGALALTPQSRYRHQFSMREMFGGVLTVDPIGGTATSYCEPHTPGMSQDIVIRQTDHAWLALLASKLLDASDAARKQIRALEYYYRAWPLDPSERFPWLFMSLDAIFGDSSAATQAVIDAVGQYGEAGFDYERLRLLLGLRASVIHGGAPDVYDLSKYHRYYESYGEDPIVDLGVIVARCLRAVIFAGTLVPHPDPHADLIRAHFGDAHVSREW